jgi:hypothetical protein
LPVAIQKPVLEAKHQVVEHVVRNYFSDAPILANVAWCESKFRHFKADGSVLRGEVVPSDIGVMQINEYYHGKTANAFGIDIHTLEGNLEYARYLYEKEGTTPWLSSVRCWGYENHITKV